MRLATLFFLVLSSVCVAQDTNFSAGPQYLMNFGSPLLLHPIATPSLSLSTPPATTPAAPPEAGTGEPRTPAFGGLQTEAAIDRIYWGEPKTGPSEPSANSSEIALTATQPSLPLPAGFLDTGVTSITDPESVHGEYEVSLGEVARSSKATRTHAERVYTNADIVRLRGDR